MNGKESVLIISIELLGFFFPHDQYEDIHKDEVRFLFIRLPDNYGYEKRVTASIHNR